jgi:hypothetical protein
MAWVPSRSCRSEPTPPQPISTNPATRPAIARELLAGSSGSWLRPPAWYRALTAHILPARLRDDFGLSYGDAERRAAERSLTWIRRLYPRLPYRLRHVGPYQEAGARLASRQHPDPVTRLLNRFRIGRPRLAE